MIEALILKAEKREHTGTSEARKLRKEGKVPGIVYGHNIEPVAVALNYHDLALEIQHHHRLLEVELEGQREKLLIKEVQRDHLGERIQHVDLARVSMDERVQVTVSVELRGTPVGAADGGVLEQLMGAVELECLVTSIPENIRMTVLEMQVGDTLTAKDLELPEGTKLITDPDSPVASVRVMAEEVEEAVPTEEGEVEPEVISVHEKAEEQEKSEPS